MRSVPRAIVFDVDGTLLDSAPGIVAGFAHALRTMGLEPPDEAVLRSDLGPPVDIVLARFGVLPDRAAAAKLAYRTFYLAEGLQLSVPYPGVPELLDGLAERGVALGTATAKRTETARAILDHHGLADRFQVVNGTTDTRITKQDTIAATLALMDVEPGPDVWMVGDRHLDISAARLCGVRSIGVSWGYGSRAELVEAAPDLIVDHPAELLDLELRTRSSAESAGSRRSDPATRTPGLEPPHSWSPEPGRTTLPRSGSSR